MKLYFVHYLISETQLYVSENYSGNIDKSVMVNVIVIFELSKGPHNLYLKAVSVGNDANIDLTNAGMECLSYRNFKDLDHKKA